MNIKQSANVFGTFLDTVSSAPSKSAIDLDSVTSQALGWYSKPRPDEPAPQQEGADSGPLVTLLKTIGSSAEPISISEVVKSSKLNVDSAAMAIRNALVTRLIEENPSEAGVVYRLTATGRSLIE